MEHQFAQAIDEDEGTNDRLSEYVYADWLDDLGDPRAEAWRVLLERELYPRQVRNRRNFLISSWRWYKHRYVFVPKQSQIGKDFFLQLPGIEHQAKKKETVVWIARSYFAAMNAAAIAWVRVERDPLYLRFK